MLDCAREGRPDRARGGLLYHPPRSDTAKPTKEDERPTEGGERRRKKVFSDDADEASEEAMEGDAKARDGRTEIRQWSRSTAEGREKKEGRRRMDVIGSFRMYVLSEPKAQRR